MESNTIQFTKIKAIIIFMAILLFSSCYPEKDDRDEKLFFLSLLQRILSADAENCQFNSVTSGTLLEDPLNDVQLEGTREFLTTSAGYKDISNFEVNLFTSFILDLTLREFPTNGLPAFQTEPLDKILSEYILDLKTESESYTINLTRPTSTNHSPWAINTTRPIVRNNNTNAIFLCFFSNHKWKFNSYWL
jgi:hypothetical protein